MKKLLALTAIWMCVSGAAFGQWLSILPPAPTHNFYFTPQTWYINPATGGDRYSSFNLTGKCDGKGSTPWVSGVNQHCPFNSFRLLFNDPYHYGDKSYLISGSDTVMVAGLEGSNFDYIAGSTGGFCAGVGDCYMPSIPSGTSGNPTRILGVNYASCGSNRYGGDPAQVEHLRADGSAAGYYALMFFQSQYVDVECLDINGMGTALAGVFTGNHGQARTAANITLKNITVQGFSVGLSGPLAGLFTMTDLDFYMNSHGGINLDDGNGDLSTGSIVGSWLRTHWSCQEEWPITHAIPVAFHGCGDQNSGVVADGFGTPPTHLDFTCDHCDGSFNTQDGWDLTHVIDSTILFTNSTAQANMGGNFKFSSVRSLLSYNNTAVANCFRMSEPITGAQAGFNSFLSDWCRAGGDQNTWGYVSNDLYLGEASAVGTAVTGTGTHFLTDLAIGNTVEPATEPFATYARTVTAIADDTHLTVNSAYPTDWSEHFLHTPGGTPFSVSTVKMYHDVFTGYGATTMDGGCSFGLKAGGGYAGAPANKDHCPGATFDFRDNIVLGLVDPNCTTGGNCGDGDTPPGMWYGELPTTQDYSFFYNLRACPAVGAHDNCSTNPLFVSQPALTLPLNGEATLDNFNFNLDGVSGAVAAGVTITGQTNDQAGVAWASPPSVGALQYVNVDQTATPSISPGTGSYSSVTVTLGDTTPSAVICYKFGSVATTNGLGTGCGAGSTLYTVTFPVTTTSTLYAIAQAPGFTVSFDNHADYTITTPSVQGGFIGVSTLKGTLTVTTQ